MARNSILTLVERGRDERGFTLTEVATVCAIVGIMGVLAFPSLKRFNTAQETKSSATQMAGVLEDARSRAVAEATPHLVFVNDPSETRGEGGAGGCGTMAVVVRDSDRTYTVTDGDNVREIAMPSEACDKVKLYGKDAASTPFEDMRMPAEDQAVLDRGLLGGLTDPNGLVGGVLGGVGELLGGGSGSGRSGSGESGSSGSGRSGSGESGSGESGSSGSGSSGSGRSGETRGEEVREAVVNGSTFPVDEASGKPVIAFSERGVPVDPRNPTSWGSGAGAIYLTDGTETVYAALVEPMGSIKLRKYEPTTQKWR